MPLGNKGEKFYTHFSCIFSKWYTYAYTPQMMPHFEMTRTVLGLDDNGKVGACEWNHLQRADQFLISSVCYEKKKLNIQNSVTKPQNFKPQFK